MRKSTAVVSSGEAVSYDSDSKQTIPGPVGHSAELGEAVALAASPFSGTSFRRIALVAVRVHHVAGGSVIRITASCERLLCIAYPIA